MADIIVSGAKKEREFRGKSCCYYRDRGVIVEFLVEKVLIVSSAEAASAETATVVVVEEEVKLIQSGFVH
jgi:hypothetical protein